MSNIPHQQRLVQCSGTTAAGKRCKQRLAVLWPLHKPFDETTEVRCALHPEEVTEDQQACMSNRCIHKKPWLYDEDGKLKA